MTVMLELRAVLSAQPEQVAHARHLVAEYLNMSGDSEIAVLLVSELVTNAIVHGGSSCELRAQQTRGGLRVEVHDQNPESAPILNAGPPLNESGRGLQLVDTLADRWGWTENDHGKFVWFEIDE